MVEVVYGFTHRPCSSNKIGSLITYQIPWIASSTSETEKAVQKGIRLKSLNDVQVDSSNCRAGENRSPFFDLTSALFHLDRPKQVNKRMEEGRTIRRYPTLG